MANIGFYQCLNNSFFAPFELHLTFSYNSMLTNRDYTQIFRLQSFPGDIVFLSLTNIYLHIYLSFVLSKLLQLS